MPIVRRHALFLRVCTNVYIVLMYFLIIFVAISTKKKQKIRQRPIITLTIIYEQIALKKYSTNTWSEVELWPQARGYRLTLNKRIYPINHRTRYLWVFKMEQTFTMVCLLNSCRGNKVWVELETSPTRRALWLTSWSDTHSPGLP